MKLIKGKYQTELREHENINTYTFSDYDYYLKDNGNFTYSLNYIYYDLDEEDYIIEKVCNLPQNWQQYFKIEDLRDKVQKHIKLKKEVA